MHPSTVYCDNCGAANRPTARFCTKCGQTMPAASPLPPTVLAGVAASPPTPPLMQAAPAPPSSSLTGLLPANSLLKGRYLILSRLGQGGMGAVYKAEDTQLGNRLVAVKEMSQKGLDPQELAEATQTFKHEALLLASLPHHANLPSIYDHFAEGGRWYLVMDFIAGQTLEEYLAKAGGKLPVQEVLDIGIQLTTVLDYLHTHQPPIIFRDLKPANVMRTANAQLYLIDFGIARHFKPGQVKDTIAYGSAGYAAPEQYGKAQTTPQSDIYSLGATLHHLLSGSDPALSPFQFAPLSGAGISADLKELIARMVTTDVKQRPASMIEVKQQLQRIAAQPAPSPLPPMSSQPPPTPSPLAPAVSVPPPLPPTRLAATPLPATTQPPQRGISRRAVIGGLAGLAVVGVAGGGLLWLTRAQPSPQTQPTQNPTPTVAPPNPAINSSGAMFGFDLQHTRFNPDEHLISSANVSLLVPYWTAKTGASIYASPVVAEGRVYVGSYDSKLYALDATTGKILWTAPTTSVIPASPAVANGRIYVGSNDFNLYTLDATTGEILWSQRTGSFISLSSPAVANGRVYVGSYDSKLYAFDALTGARLWTATTGDKIRSSPAVANGRVYVGSDDHNLYALDATTGARLWTATTGGKIRSSPMVAKGVVFVGSEDDHNLYAFDALTGARLWTATTGDQIESSPIVANGVVFVGSVDGKLYAFHLH